MGNIALGASVQAPGRVLARRADVDRVKPSEPHDFFDDTCCVRSDRQC